MPVSFEFYLAVLAVFFAGILRGFSGFGVGMVLVPSLSLLYSPVTAVITVVLLEIVPSIQLFPDAIKKCHWQSVVPMSLTALITIPIGSLILIHTNADVMRIVIAMLIIISVLILAVGWKYKGAYTPMSSVMTGAASGLISGASSLGGLPIILYYLSGRLSTSVARASIVIFLVFTALLSVTTFSLHGVISKDILIRAVWLVPPFIVAIWIGGRLFGQVSESTFRAITLTFLGSVGVMMLMSYK